MPGSFVDIMIDAQRALLTLDGLTERDGSKETAAAVSRGKLASEQLLEHQRTAMLTRPEANALQSAVDLLRARLRFFGEGL